MKDARFTIPTPALLARVVDLLEHVPMEDRDTKGDIYEYMLGKIASAGQNGQFRTPSHIIRLMVEMTAPQPTDIVCDPASGTCGFLVAVGEYLRVHHPEIFPDARLREHFHHGMFHGFDFDNTMLRIGSMNLLLHGVENPDIVYRDPLLKEAGWALDQPQDREFPVSGMPNQQGTGFVDYVLWGDDGKPLALVEAKRTRRDARVGQQQAKLYADCLEQQCGQRPVTFYSNGYEHWLWDDASYPPRPVQGFFTKAELELMIQRRTTRLSLAEAEIDPAIVERYYQTRAIRRIGEAFEKDHERKALVVMATGTGQPGGERL
jgi:N-6 DNA methylase/type I restriction and modification enzyme subunit R-like protein